MLKQIRMCFSEEPQTIDIEGGGVTILVGPNNSGKSLALREISKYFTEGHLNANKIIEKIEIEVPPLRDIMSFIDSIKKSNNTPAPDYITIGGFSGEESLSIYLPVLNNSYNYKDMGFLLRNILRHKIIKLDGRTRFDLTADKQIGDLTQSPSNVLVRIFQDDDLRAEVREIIKEAFGLYFVIDPTNGGSLRVRLSAVPPTRDEQSLNKDARLFHSQATYIKEASDGAQAFVGILMSIKSGQYDATLIDEPEAFLHPPLARFLGKKLASAIGSSTNTMIAATHSADFLLGCLQGSKNVRVIRLEYSNGKSRGRLLDTNDLNLLFRHPLIRSANVMSALFYDGVIVTESDNDRVFYNEIYLRLTEEIANLPSILVINAQNKQTIKSIMGPLRRFGIAAAAIADIDVLKDGGQVFTDWMKSANIPLALHSGLIANRTTILQAMQNSGSDMKSKGIQGCLTGDNLEAANVFLNTLNDYGIFPVRTGELENWLPNLGINGKKTDWAIDALEKLGADPADPHYVKPSDNDVWVFIATILKWIGNPARKG